MDLASAAKQNQLKKHLKLRLLIKSVLKLSTDHFPSDIAGNVRLTIRNINIRCHLKNSNLYLNLSDPGISYISQKTLVNCVLDDIRNTIATAQENAKDLVQLDPIEYGIIEAEKHKRELCKKYAKKKLEKQVLTVQCARTITDPQFGKAADLTRKDFLYSLSRAHFLRELFTNEILNTTPLAKTALAEVNGYLDNALSCK